MCDQGSIICFRKLRTVPEQERNHRKYAIAYHAALANQSATQQLAYLSSLDRSAFIVPGSVYDTTSLIYVLGAGC